MLPVQTPLLYNLKVPSSGKVVNFRPFLVKEQKVLLIAQASEDVKVMIDTLKQLIRSCIQDEIDIDRLAMFDIEYIFTQIRSKSVGETVDLTLQCTHCENENNTVVQSVDVSKIEVVVPENHKSKIELFDDVGIIMNYPSLDIINKYQGSKEDVSTIFSVIIECIDCIYNSKEVFKKKDQSQKDLETFLENLNTQQFEKIKLFFETMPSLKKDLEFDCPACKAHNKVTLEGISSFF